MTKQEENQYDDYSIIDKINDYFQIPIYYNDKKVKIKNNIRKIIKKIKLFKIIIIFYNHNYMRLVKQKII